MTIGRAVLGGLVAAAAAVAATAQECVDYAQQVQFVGREPVPAVALWDLAVDGQYAYCAGFQEAGLEIIDISDPTQPRPVGVSGVPVWPASAWSVAQSGDMAYVVGESALYTFDVSDRTAPALRGTASFAVVGWSVEVEGNTAYVLASGDSLLVYDVGDPTAPVLVGSLGGISVNGSGYGDLSVLADDMLFVAGYVGVTIVDVADPTAPAVLGEVPMADKVAGVALDGNLLYAVTLPFATLHIVDVSRPADPQILATVALPRSGETVAVSGTRAYIAGCCGIEIVDISVPAAPVYLGNAAMTSTAYGMVARDDRLYLATTSGMRICDTSYPTVFGPSGGVILAANALRLATAPDRLYIVDAAGDLRILDASPAGDPVEIGVYSGSGIAKGMAVQGSLAFVVDNLRGFDVVDVADAGSPIRVGSLVLPDAAGAVTVVGDLAYVGTDRMGLVIVDVTDPGVPVVLGGWNDGVGVLSTAVAGHHAFVVGGDRDLRVIDVTDPRVPSPVVTMDLGGGCMDITVVGDVAYIADVFGLFVVDVGDPSYPVTLGFRTVDGYRNTVAAAGDKVYLGNTAGVTVFDVADPAHPIELGSVRSPSGTSDLVATDRIYAATATDGVIWAPLQCPDSVLGTIGGGDDDGEPVVPAPFLALDISPNPFNPRAEVRFVLDRAEAVRVAVHDLRGRRVRTLADGVQPAGPCLMVWDGRDEAGRAVESGVYLVHLATDRGVTASKLTLLR